MSKLYLKQNELRLAKSQIGENNEFSELLNKNYKRFSHNEKV